MRTFFEVRSLLPKAAAQRLMANNNLVTKHWANDRQGRLRECTGNRDVYNAFVVDTHHRNGLEAHIMLRSAEILIYNLRTGRLITVLFARPGQIRRYGVTDRAVLQCAMENHRTGKNSI